MYKSIFFIFFICVSNFSHSEISAKEQMLTKMDTFCKEAGGEVKVFENTCANACILYDRKTGIEIKDKNTQCQEKKVYSCQCPEKQCLKGNKCENIIIGL